MAGLEPDDSPFCGVVTQLGVQFSDPCVCTGFAAHLALPMLRQLHSPDKSLADAKSLMMDALRVCCLAALVALCRLFSPQWAKSLMTEALRVCCFAALVALCRLFQCNFHHL